MSVGKNAATAIILVILLSYFAYYAIYSLIAGNAFTPFVLTYFFVISVVLARSWPNLVYAMLLPYTEWKMYKRDYLRLNRLYRKILSFAKPLGLTSYAEIVTRCNLANIQLQLGEYEEGESIYRHCLELLYNMRPNPRINNVHGLYSVYINCGLAVALCHEEKYLEAELLMASVFDVINSKKFSAGLYEGYAYYLLGHTHIGLKESSAEENVLKAIKTISAVKNAQGEHSRGQMLNACNLALARIYFENARVDEATKYYDKYFADLEEGRSTVSPLAVKDLSAIANSLLGLHDYARAEKTLQLCYYLMAPTPFAPLAKRTLLMYETLLNETNRANEVADLKCWLHPVSLLKC